MLFEEGQSSSVKWTLVGAMICFVLMMPLYMSASSGWFEGRGWLDECKITGDSILNLTCVARPGEMCPLGLAAFSSSVAAALAMLGVMMLLATRRACAARWLAWSSAALVAVTSFAFVLGGLRRRWQPGWVVIAAANAVATQMVLAGFL